MEVDRWWEANPGIAHPQGYPSVSIGMQFDADLPGPPIRKSMFEAIGHQFVEQETARNGLIDLQKELVELRCERHAPGKSVIGPYELAGEGANIVGEVNPCQVHRLIQGFMDESHRPDPVLAV